MTEFGFLKQYVVDFELAVPNQKDSKYVQRFSKVFIEDEKTIDAKLIKVGKALEKIVPPYGQMKLQRILVTKAESIDLGGLTNNDDYNEMQKFLDETVTIKKP